MDKHCDVFSKTLCAITIGAALWRDVYRDFILRVSSRAMWCASKSYTSLVFNDNMVQFPSSQTYLGLTLDFKLDFNERTGSKINKCKKIIGVIKYFL